jgi:hypothetical protein
MAENENWDGKFIRSISALWGRCPFYDVPGSE